MLKRIVTAAGMVLLASSFALAGQSHSSPTAPVTPHQRVTVQPETTQTTKSHRKAGKKHHRKHKHQAAAPTHK